MLCPTVFSNKQLPHILLIAYLDFSSALQALHFPLFTSESDRLPNRYSQQLAVLVTFLHVALLRSVPEYGQIFRKSREALLFGSNDLAQTELWRRECTLQPREREKPA